MQLNCQQAQNRASSPDAGPPPSHHQQPPSTGTSTGRSHTGPFSAIRSKLHALSEEDRIEHERDAADAQARLDAAVARRDQDAAQALRPPSSGGIRAFGQGFGFFGYPEELRKDEEMATAQYSKEITRPGSGTGSSSSYGHR